MRLKGSRASGISAAAALALLAGVHSAEGRVLRVPEDYPTVLAGVDAAVAGDSVVVGPGTWNQAETRPVQLCANFVNERCVAFLKPGISLIATAGPGTTILDGGPRTNSVVHTLLHYLPGTAPTRVEGFTITGGDTGVGEGCTNSRLEFVNCRIVGNGNAAIGFDQCQLRVADCVISDTHLIDRHHGAVACNGGVDVEFVRTRFERNQLGALDLSSATHVLIEDCDFVDHHGYPALGLTSCPDATVRGSRFFRNTTSAGGAASLQDTSALLEFCTFAYDSATSTSGGAVLLGYAGTYTIRNCTFERCYALYYGAAVGMGAGDLGFERNVVANCRGLSAVAQSGGGILTTGCDVYSANQENFYGWSPAVTDIFADPQFCNAPALDFTLNAASPCLPGNGNPACTELIGALGQGCGVVSIEPLSWGRLKGIYRAEGSDEP